MKKQFDKGYLANWSKELYTIHKRIGWSPPVYKLLEPDGEIRDGVYYERELEATE